MAIPEFVHLRVHTDHSIADGIVSIDAWVAAAQADGMGAVGISDLNNMFGFVKFYKACRQQGIKPIVGVDVWVESDQAGSPPVRLLLIARSHDGYLRLCHILTEAYLHHQEQGKAILQRCWLQAMGANEGLLLVSGALRGDIGQALLNGQAQVAEDLAREWAQYFPDRFYIELQRAGHPQTELYIRGAMALAETLQLPVVATHPVQFISPDEFRAHEARVCISEGWTLSDSRRPKLFTEEQFFLSQQQMFERFSDIPEALQNTVEIAKRCNLIVELGRPLLPQFPTPEGMSFDEYLRHLSNQGLLSRLQVHHDAASLEKVLGRYQARLDFELSTIIQMGFSGYFLIVQDFINWAKCHQVAVGPGRGSGAGSLVAYALGITDLDPTQYDLLFERFLNPERVSMPDFDIDFCQDNRHKVIDYVKQKYGLDAVSQIATFGTMAAKAAVRDIGRVLDLPYGFVDGIAKLIPFEPGKSITLKMARELEPHLAERERDEEEVRDCLVLAEQIEGLIRNVGMHAGGVLIAPGRLTDFCPLYCAQGSQDVVAQFDKDDVEAVGLVKFDFLGLRTLTILEWAVRYAKQLSKSSETLILDTSSFDDSGTYALLSDANTTAVFQLESQGMRNLLVKLKPSNFEDIIAVLALFRPGPLGSGMVDDFVNRKHGRAKAEYFHPDLEGVLKPTYGVIVYQEQVMLISQIIGGYTLGGADLLRRAMGKKKPDEMAEHREIFQKGAEAKGYPLSLATHLFDLMEKFAEYGFNKSHTAAYAVLAYQTAWLKVHHRAAMMAATLSVDMDDTDKIQIFYQDTIQNGVRILPPDINHSSYRFVPVDESTIRYGLGALKGVGESAVLEIIRAREQGGVFADLFDLCERTDKSMVNRRVVEALIRAGAFDALNCHRSQLFEAVPLAFEWAELAAQNRYQTSLFSLFEEEGSMVAARPEMPDVPEWDCRRSLQEEKLALGFFVSGHPFSAYEAELRSMVRLRLADVAPSRDAVLLAGIITGIRSMSTKRGRVTFVEISDGSASHEISIFSELFEQHRQAIKEDALLIIQGKVALDNYSGRMRISAEQLYSLSQARSIFAKTVTLTLRGHVEPDTLLARLAPYRHAEGGLVTIGYDNGIACCRVVLGKSWCVRVDDDMVTDLRTVVGDEHVLIGY